jgi:K+-transporting ATPase ATPase C chain
MPRPYNPKTSSGSNLGPTNSVLIASVRQRAIDYRLANGLASDVALPVDAVTASASGLHPHISLANAKLQVARVAHARGLQATQVQQLLQSHVEPRLLGLFGEPRINVLRLNLALDVLSQKTSMESHHVR